MNGRDIDELLSQSAVRNAETSAPDAAAVNRARAAVLESLTPVRPLPRSPLLAVLFVGICAAAGIGGGIALRILGWPALTPLQRSAIFPLLAVLSAAASLLCAWEMVPGARRVRARTVFMVAFASLEAVFLLTFSDHSMGRFVHSGMSCLGAGLIVAAPVAILAIAIMRRGAVLDRSSGAAAVGLVAGLAGLCALEIHCPNLRVWHVAVWHMGVVAIAVGVAVAISGLAVLGGKREG